MSKFGKAFLKEFVLSEDYVFINHGSYGAVAKCVHEARKRLVEQFESEPDRWFRRHNWNYYAENTEAAGDFLGTNAQNIVFTSNASTGICTVLKSLRFGPEDVILINSWTYPCMKNALQWISERTGVKVIRIDIPLPLPDKEMLIKDYRETIAKNPNIKLAMIDTISSMPPVLMPYKEITDICRQNNIMTLIDGAHSPGQIHLHLDSMDVDFFVGNLHKWSYTHRGCAVLYVNPKHQSYIDPLVNSVNLNHEDLRMKFHYQGTDDSTKYYVVKNAIEFYNNIGGLSAISAYNTDLVTQAADLLVERWGTRKLEIPLDMEAPYMRMVRLPDLKAYPCVKYIPGDMSTLLGDLKELMVILMDRFKIVAVCIYLMNEPYVRLSANIYNCLEDYEKLADAILTIKAEEEP